MSEIIQLQSEEKNLFAGRRIIMKKVLALLMAVILIMGSMTACSKDGGSAEKKEVAESGSKQTTNKDGKKTNIAFFTGKVETVDLIDQIIADYNAQSNGITVEQEYQADAFSAKVLENPEPLITGLIKLNSDNLSELLPPKLYVFWNYSHPTLVERIEKLQNK